MKTLPLKKIFFLFINLFFVVACCNDDDTPATEKQGKVNIYIEGDLTNAEAQAQLEAEYGYLTENIYVQYTTQITELTIKTKYNLRSIDIKDSNLELRTIRLEGGNTKISFIGIYNSKQNTNISISGFKEANIVQIFTYGYKTDPATGYSIGTSNTTNIVCNDLVKINHQFTFIASIVDGNKIAFNDLKIVEANNSSFYWSYWRGRFDTISFPLLEEMSNIKTSHSDSYTGVPDYELGLRIANLTLPKLKKLNSFIANGKIGIERLNLPILTSLQYFGVQASSYSSSGIVYLPVYYNYNNTRFNFPLLNNCKDFYISMPNFTSADVDYYLNLFLNIQPLSGKRIGLWGETPSAQGLLNWQTLTSQGNFVWIN